MNGIGAGSPSLITLVVLKGEAAAAAAADTKFTQKMTLKQHQGGNIYHITCGNNSRHSYISETKRTLSQRFKEHTNLDKPTGVGDHCLATGHSVSMDNTKVLAREQNWHKRKVKEAIYIKQRGPTMNQDQGYHLPAIYNQIIPPESEPQHRSSVREQGIIYADQCWTVAAINPWTWGIPSTGPYCRQIKTSGQ